MDRSNSFTVVISPLNSIYWFKSNYHKSHMELIDIVKSLNESEDEVNLDEIAKKDNFTEKIKSIIEIVPYVKKEFLDKMKQKGVRLKLLIKSKEELPITKFIYNYLNIQEYFNFDEDVIFLDYAISNSEKQIIISESVEDLIKFHQSGNYTILNHLLFSDNKDYLQLQERNLNLLIENKDSFQPNQIIESLRQSNELIFYLDDNRNSSPVEYFKSALKVLYMFDSKSGSKNYRKRGFSISTNKIHFTPVINRNFILNEDNFLYHEESDFHVFLQRCPNFYISNQSVCYRIEKLLQNKKSTIIMHNFKFIDALFNRYQVYKLLVDFVNQIKHKFYDKFGINIQIPYSTNFSIEEDIKYKDDHGEIDISSSLNSIKSHIKKLIENDLENLNYPFIIKPDRCADHEMYLILSPEGIENFANPLNFPKILKMTNFIFQKFIPHGGLMFKNYYINRKPFTIVRPSIPNLEGKILESKRFENNCFTFHNEFLYTKEDPSLWEDIQDHSAINESDINKEALDEISKSFVEVTSVSLFGLDYLFDKVNNTYYLLEVNYFPSYRELGSRLSEEFAEHIIDYYNSKKN